MGRIGDNLTDINEIVNQYSSSLDEALKQKLVNQYLVLVRPIILLTVNKYCKGNDTYDREDFHQVLLIDSWKLLTIRYKSNNQPFSHLLLYQINNKALNYVNKHNKEKKNKSNYLYVNNQIATYNIEDEILGKISMERLIDNIPDPRFKQAIRLVLQGNDIKESCKIVSMNVSVYKYQLKKLRGYI